MSHATMAVSEKSFQTLFEAVRDNFAESTSGSEDAGPFSISWNIGVRLEGGSVELQSNNSVLLSELDVVYDPLELTLGLDIPELCVGGFCLIPTPLGCALRVPRICVFSADPDVAIPINLSGILRSEISGSFRVKTRHFVDPARTPEMTYLDAEDADIPNEWQFLLDPIFLDIDLLDVPDIVGEILDRAIDNAVDTLLGPLPDWAKDLVRAVLGSLVDVIRAILDLGDDIDEWLSNLLGVSIGLFDFVLTRIADHFAKDNPIFHFEDPFPIMDADDGLIPVKIPIENVEVNVNDQEMILTADVGGTL